jgi:2-polyprenyl-3-methyl-5-hydroxy-6-metoxy-1,4-benzoquinol methylase
MKYQNNLLEKDYTCKDETYFLHERSEMLKFIPQNVNYVLDIGCSSGGFGNQIKKHFNCNVWGVEPDFKSAQKAELLLDKVLNNFYDDDLDLQNQKFDCIIFNDVLEHLVNPFSTLEMSKKHLSKNGFIIASIPNLRYYNAIKHILISKDFKYVEMGIFDKTHLRFFTKKSIERMFIEAGFKINMIEGINSIKKWDNRSYLEFKKFKFFFGNSISDMEFLQFAIVSQAD